MIPLGLVKAKATFYVITDVEGRRLGQQLGLDTLVVQAENYECRALDVKVQCVNENISIPPQE